MGATTHRDIVHSEESFRIRGKICLLDEPRGTTRLSLPLRGEAKENVRGRTFNNLNFDLSALCGLYPILPLIPHAVVVSLPATGVKGASPLQLFLFEFFFLRRKKNG